ncbi:MAG: hypothetical protein Q9203_005130 [Teloschistes exilis]
MADPISIAASVVTLVKTSRMVGSGITKLLALKHAPDILLALNNEVVDLQYTIIDLQDLEQRYQDTFDNAIPPSFRRVVERTKEVLLDLQRLISYKLTKQQTTNKYVIVDRSSWLWAHGKIVKAHQDIQECRLQLSAAVSLLISSTSIHSYERLHHSAIKLDTLLSHNAGLGQSLSRRLCGMEIQLERLAGHVASPGKNSRGISQQHMTHEPVKPHVMNSEDLVNNPALDQNIHNSPPLIIQTRVLLKLYDVDDVRDLAAEDKYGSQRPLILDRARSPNDNSTYELLGEPALQAFYRQSGNSEVFQSILARASSSDLEEIDTLGESLLFKAIRSDDTDLVYTLLQSGACVMQKNKHGTTPFAVACGVGKLSIVRYLLEYGADPTTSNKYNESPCCNAIGYALRSNRHETLKYLSSLIKQYPLLAKIRPCGLRAAAAFADAETLEILKAVKWITVDIEHLLNHRSCIYWTTRQLSEKRRSGERFPASEPEPDEDPEQIYQSFMSLLQKIIDDHYGLEGHETHSTHCRYTRRMVLIPRKDTKRYWDIVEKDVHVDRDISEVESDDEAWADAPEQPIGQQATL